MKTPKNHFTDNHYHIPEEPTNSTWMHPRLYRIVKDLGVKNVLEIGSGNGLLMHHLQQFSGGEINLVGVEPSAQGIEIARRLYPENKFYHLGCYDDPDEIKETGFEAVITVEVLEHLYSPTALVQFARAKLKPGGWLILTTPYYGYLKNLALCLLNRWDAHHYVLQDGEHIKLFSKATLRQLLRNEGFEVTAIYGFGRRPPFLWRSMVAIAKIRS